MAIRRNERQRLDQRVDPDLLLRITALSLCWRAAGPDPRAGLHLVGPTRLCGPRHAGNRQRREILPNFQRRPDQEDVSSASLLKTIEQTIASNTVLEQVVAANHLADDPEFKAPCATTRTRTTELLRRRIGVTLVRGTRLIAVSLEADSPGKARQLAQSLIDTFFAQAWRRAGTSRLGPTSSSPRRNASGKN